MLWAWEEASLHGSMRECRSRQIDRYEQKDETHKGTDVVAMSPNKLLEELKAHNILTQRHR